MTDPRLDFSNWLHGELTRDYGLEREQWALDRVERVQSRLNQLRANPPLDATILWIAPPLAFTLAGSHVYIARTLFQRLPSDDALAFVLAHEAAHHDLGHLDLFSGWAKWLPQSGATGYIAALARLYEYRTYGPEREQEADDYAVRLALRAGYNGDLAVQALVILETIALDHGDYNAVYGPENLLDPTAPTHDTATYHVQRWVWTHLHGYLPLHERVANARRLLRSLPSERS